jgi:hypothetical protein
MTSADFGTTGGFAGLRVFVQESSTLIESALGQLMDVSDLDDGLGASIPLAREAVRARSRDVLAAIESGDFDSALNDHGLADGTPEWEFKFAVFRASHRRYNELTANDAGAGGVRGLLSSLRHPLKSINVILRSVAAAIPGVGGALTELKDGTEAAVDLYAGE